MSEYLTDEDVEKAHWEYIDEMGEDSYDHVPFRVPTKAAMTAALDAVLPEIIRRAKQDAWGEGWQAQLTFIRTGVLTNNPYCTETDEETT